MEKQENKNSYKDLLSRKAKKLSGIKVLGDFLMGLRYILLGLLMVLYYILKILGMVILHIFYVSVFLFPIIVLFFGLIYCVSFFRDYSLYIALSATIAILISAFILLFFFIRYEIWNWMWKLWDKTFDVFDNLFDYSGK
ncbi:MAG: hypothetical protein LBE13_05545 [Bacteroidales bacterium]|jgi:hypothetical protein|nr:hypothetical protein [Bacteroidales bacterium]